MGISSAAAAGIAGSMVIIFGGTAAGLAGYRMKERTQGLTDFEFKQYEEKVNSRTFRVWNAFIHIRLSYFGSEQAGGDDHGVRVDGGR